MTRPQKVRVSRRAQSRVPVVPPLPPEPAGAPEVHSQADATTPATEVIGADVHSSPLTPQVDSVSGGPLDSAPAGNPYDEFGDDFDQEDEVDDYALLHPNSPRDVPMDPLHFTTENHPVPPFQSTSPGPSRQIRFVSPIVVTHSPVGTPADVPVAKRRRRKTASPHKDSPERIPASDKGKGRAPVTEGDASTAQQSVIQYWANANEPAILPAHGPGAGPLDPTIGAFLQDIRSYVQRFEELGPEATAGLIYHAHKKLQSSLLNGALPDLHAIPVSDNNHNFLPTPGIPPTASSLQGLQPSPVIVRPGTGESCILHTSATLSLTSLRLGLDIIRHDLRKA
jgi:hypothetical protein